MAETTWGVWEMDVAGFQICSAAKIFHLNSSPCFLLVLKEVLLRASWVFLCIFSTVQCADLWRILWYAESNKGSLKLCVPDEYHKEMFLQSDLSIGKCSSAEYIITNLLKESVLLINIFVIFFIQEKKQHLKKVIIHLFFILLYALFFIFSRTFDGRLLAVPLADGTSHLCKPQTHNFSVSDLKEPDLDSNFFKCFYIQTVENVWKTSFEIFSFNIHMSRQRCICIR